VSLAHRIRQRYSTAPPRILILTGDTSPAKLAELRASGFRLATKPVRPARLRAIISKIMEKGQTVRGD
jgi:CheY-like chemotaxis protein